MSGNGQEKSHLGYFFIVGYLWKVIYYLYVSKIIAFISVIFMSNFWVALSNLTVWNAIQCGSLIVFGSNAQLCCSYCWFRTNSAHKMCVQTYNTAINLEKHCFIIHKAEWLSKQQSQPQNEQCKKSSEAIV